MPFEGHFKQAELQEYMGKVFGAGYTVEGTTRLAGGAQKVVYRIDCENGFSCALYAWDLSMNYFREEILSEPVHQRSYGGRLFAANNRYLRRMGIRTPELYDLNADRDRFPFDYALVEFVRGRKAEAYLRHEDSSLRHELFRRIGRMVTDMHAIERNTYGKPDFAGPNEKPCHALQREHAFKSLSYAAEHMATVRDRYAELLGKLEEREALLLPRSRYGFIHGELGPDHVLVDDEMRPFLIDIEGAEFYDIEHEHSFLELRFGEDYGYFGNDRLDADRMSFYRYCHHLSLIAGGLKLLHRNFPDRAFAQGLAEYHARRAIEVACGGQ